MATENVWQTKTDRWQESIPMHPLRRLSAKFTSTEVYCACRHHAQLLDGSLEIWVSEHSPRAHKGTSAGRVRACNRLKGHTRRNRRSVLNIACDLDMFMYGNLAMTTRRTVALKALLAKHTYGKRLSTLSGAKAPIGASVGACYQSTFQI